MSFRTTRWSVIDAARDGDQSAYQDLVLRYRPAVERYLSRRGLGSEAADLGQEVFLQLFRGGGLERADADLGRFRSLVLAVARNVANNFLRDRQAGKRGGGQRPLSLAELDVPSPQETDAFDREWLTQLLSLALGRLEQAYPHYYAALHRFAVLDHPYKQIAAELGRSAADVKNLIYRGKQKLIGFLDEEVQRYTTSRQEHATELELMARYLGGGG